jgi:prepilin-type N-terminal cleavage/methylation domain-containing protein
MTSGAGDGPRALPGARPTLRAFTIVEVLVVIAIMTILFTLVLLASSQLRNKANMENTKAMIQRLRDNLEEYRRLRGSYPPDGYDSEVRNKDGKPIWGSACLYEFLAKEFTVEEEVGGQVRRNRHAPLISFTEAELTAEDPESPGIREVKDGFGLPFHYDNTEDDSFRPDKQAEAAHMEPVKDHPPDPRDDPQAVPNRGIQRRRAYDLWSHGSARGHDPQADLRLTVGTWNVDVDKPQGSEPAEAKEAQ